MAIKNFFWKIFKNSLLVKIYNFPHPVPLSFSPSVDISPPKLGFGLYTGPRTKIVIFKIDLRQIYNIAFEPSPYIWGGGTAAIQLEGVY